MEVFESGDVVSFDLEERTDEKVVSPKARNKKESKKKKKAKKSAQLCSAGRVQRRPKSDEGHTCSLEIDFGALESASPCSLHRCCTQLSVPLPSGNPIFEDDSFAQSPTSRLSRSSPVDSVKAFTPPEEPSMMEVFESGDVVSFDMEGRSEEKVVSPKARNKKEAKKKAKKKRDKKSKKSSGKGSPREVDGSSPRKMDEECSATPIFEDEFQSAVQQPRTQPEPKSMDSEDRTQFCSIEVDFGAKHNAFHAALVHGAAFCVTPCNVQTAGNPIFENDSNPQSPTITVKARGGKAIKGATARELHLVAKGLLEQGDLKAALRYQEDALALERIGKGDVHPDTLECISRVGETYLRMGSFDDAEPLLKVAATTVELQGFIPPMPWNVLLPTNPALWMS